MMEQWHKADSWILSIYALPYILFYIGIGLHLRSIAQPELITAARYVHLKYYFYGQLTCILMLELYWPLILNFGIYFHYVLSVPSSFGDRNYS